MALTPRDLTVILYRCKALERTDAYYEIRTQTRNLPILFLEQYNVYKLLLLAARLGASGLRWISIRFYYENRRPVVERDVRKRFRIFFQQTSACYFQKKKSYKTAS